MADINRESELLAEIYRNTHYALNSISDILPETEDEALREELKKIRQDGYAITHGEYVTDALGIGAPVFNSDGELAGSIGIIAPEIRVDTPEFLDTQKDLVQFYASSLSADLGYEKHDVFQ